MGAWHWGQEKGVQRCFSQSIAALIFCPAYKKENVWLSHSRCPCGNTSDTDNELSRHYLLRMLQRLEDYTLLTQWLRFCVLCIYFQQGLLLLTFCMVPTAYQ
ncbi:unnamed protein product [Ixodes persulcatus]